MNLFKAKPVVNFYKTGKSLVISNDECDLIIDVNNDKCAAIVDYLYSKSTDGVISFSENEYQMKQLVIPYSKNIVNAVRALNPRYLGTQILKDSIIFSGYSRT